MLYPSAEYTYVDENGQSVDPSQFVQHVYAENFEQPSSNYIIDGNSYDTHQQSAQYRPAVVNGSQPLAKCGVLYLGTAISSTGQRGIDAIQEPLSRRYPVDGKEVVRGIETWLSIYENGLQLQFARDPSVVLFYPIRSLVYCASIRFATRTQTGAEFPNGWRFVPLDSPAAARMENTRNPPLFAVTFRRTRHLPVDECHCFVTKTRQAALALVQACFSAYQATTPQQDCSKVPLYFKVDDYGSKDKEINNEIRIIQAPDRERTLDYQTSTEGAGFFYKTDRIPIDIWQLWEHHKYDTDRATSKSRLSRSRSPSCSSSRSRSSSSSCSSCHRDRRSRRRRLASIASISTLPQPQHFHPQQPLLGSNSQSLMANTTLSTTTASIQQAAPTNMDPYAPAPNLVRVERIKDVNSGQDVFIRWVSDANHVATMNDEQQSSVPKQAYSTQPPNPPGNNYNYPIERDIASDELERLTLHDEHLRKSLLFDDRATSALPHHEEKKKKKKKKKKDKYRDSDNQDGNYEVVNGFFEDRHGRRRPIQLDHARVNHVKDYRHLHNDVVNASIPDSDSHHRRRHHRGASVIRPLAREQTHSQLPTPIFPLPNQQSNRPFGTTFLPRSAPLYPQQMFNTPAPLLNRPNFMPRPQLSHPPFWYRPMY